MELVENIQEDVAGLYFRSVLLDEDMKIEQHVHPYDHATLVASGAADVIIDGALAGTYWAGQAVAIKANHKHEFIALLPNTRLVCIHHTASAVAAMEVAPCRGDLPPQEPHQA